jgi:hypothetical protein
MDRPLLHQTRNPPGSLDSSACQRERSTVQSVGHLAGPDTAKPVSATALPRTSPPAPAPNTSTRAPRRLHARRHLLPHKQRRRAMFQKKKNAAGPWVWAIWWKRRQLPTGGGRKSVGAP